MEKNFLGNSSKNKISALLFFSSISLTLFSVFAASQNMIAQIYTQLGYSNLGNLANLFYFLSNSISAIILPNIFKYISLKTAFLISGIGVIIFELSCIFTDYCSENEDLFFCDVTIIYVVDMISGFIMGMGNTLNWIAQCGYVTNLSSSDNKAFFFKLFYSIYMSYFLLSSFITIVIIEYSKSQFYFFVFCGIICSLAAFFYLLIPNVDKLNFIKNEEKGNLQRIEDIITLFRKKITRKVTFLCWFIGTENGFYMSFLYKLIEKTLEVVNDEETNVKTAYVFACLGAFEIVGGTFSSIFGEKVNKSYLNASAFVSIGFTFVFANFIVFENHNYLYCFLIGGCVGFGDCILQSMVNIIISHEENDIENFAHYISLLNLSSFCSVLCSMIFSNYIYISYLYVVYVLCFFFVIYCK